MVKICFATGLGQVQVMLKVKIVKIMKIAKIVIIAKIAKIVKIAKVVKIAKIFCRYKFFTNCEMDYPFSRLFQPRIFDHSFLTIPFLPLISSYKET